MIGVVLSALVLFGVGAYQAVTLVGDWCEKGLQMLVIGLAPPPSDSSSVFSSTALEAEQNRPWLSWSSRDVHGYGPHHVFVSQDFKVIGAND